MAKLLSVGPFSDPCQDDGCGGVRYRPYRDFGLLRRRAQAPSVRYDTLNYNWRLWDTCAFSLYTDCTDTIDEKAAEKRQKRSCDL